MLYALCRYVEGESLKDIADRFSDRGIAGASEVSIFRACRRFERWWGDGRTLDELDDLLAVLAPPNQYRQSLTRTLVPELQRIAGPASGLPKSLQWQQWPLPEILFFVRIGYPPPRVLDYLAAGEPNDEVNWVRVTAAFNEDSATPEMQQDWSDVLGAWREFAGDAPPIPLARNASRETVRKAMLKGSYPHRWKKSVRWGPASKGNWVPLKHCLLPQTKQKEADQSGR